MPADEEIDGIEIAGADVPAAPILPPTTDPADTCDAYAEIEYAGACVNEDAIYPDLTIEGDTCDAYAEIEYAGACVDPETVYPGFPAPSTVEELNTSLGRLGCGKNTAFITWKCARRMKCQLNSIISLSWNRKLDDISEAEIVIQTSGDGNIGCCECLSDLEPWCHELHIMRDGVEVWVGPLTEIEYAYDTVTLRAVDLLGWLTVRIPIIDICGAMTSPCNPNVAAELTDIAEYMLDLAFAEDDPCPTVISVPTGIVGKRFYQAYQDTFFNYLKDLASTGLDFVALGRTLYFSGDASAALRPLVQLTDNQILGDIKVLKSGLTMANRYYTPYINDNDIPALSESAELYCYGRIERLLDEAGVYDQASAEDVGDLYAAATAIAPRILEIPPGSRLAPDTPWTINDMAPGVRVDVSVTKLCFNIGQSFKLTEVQLTDSATDGEAVAITLAPRNTPETP